VAKATQPACRNGQIGYGRKRRFLHPLHHQLRDPVAPADFEVSDRISVDDNDRDLVAVAGVDQARTVGERDPMAQRQSAARLNEPGVAGRDRHPDAGRDERSAAAGGDHRACARHQVGSGVARSGVRGGRQTGI